MCGIFALFSNKKIENGSAKSLDALKAILHRGPDEQHVWSNDEKNVFLAHCRLKITGESGSQPLWNKERTIAAIVNGQFYDFDNLRNKAINDGYQFQTETDSELLIYLYSKYGVDCLKYLDGEYAFVLYDRKENLVFASRDRNGVKPLKYSFDGEKIYFSSEAKAIIAAGLIPIWDKIALTQSIFFQYPNPSRTIFKNINQIQAGQYLIYDLKDNYIYLNKWFNWFDSNFYSSDVLENKRIKSLTQKEVNEEYISLLTKSMEERLDTNWPVAIHLSAGCDSTVALLLSKKLNKNVTAFSVGFENDERSTIIHDESLIASQTAKKLNIPFEKVFVTRKDILNNWSKAIKASENISINGHLVAKWLLSKKINEKGFRISISGEGSDESLLGYSFLNAENHCDINKIKENNKVSVGLMLPDNYTLKYNTIEKEWGFVPIWLQAKSSIAYKLSSLLKEEFIDLFNEAEKDWAYSTKDFVNKQDNNIHKSASSWANLALSGYILPSLADSPETNHQIQGRTPFLDKNVLEFAFKLKPEQTCLENENKTMLRDFLRKNNLSEIANRGKHPFQAPPLLADDYVMREIESLFIDYDWEDTPFCKSKINKLVKEWKSWDVSKYQQWEPAICILLSIMHLQKEYGLKI